VAIGGGGWGGGGWGLVAVVGGRDGLAPVILALYVEHFAVRDV
jgi:hypothetical protein